MREASISTRMMSVRLKLANLLALLAVALFVTHAAMTEDSLSSIHVHATAAFTAPDIAAEPGSNHAHSLMVSENFDETGTGNFACCGKACLSALLPNDDSCMEWPWDAGVKSFILVSLFRGREPEGLRRPPRSLV